MGPSHLELFLFCARPELALEAEAAGVTSIIVDWENQGKHARQEHHDTEVNCDTLDDLKRLASVLTIPITVRVNGGAAGMDELEIALDHGARIIMYPMARSAREAERFLQRVRGRAQTLIQIETQDLVNDLNGFAQLDWTYSYIGLNDLMISRGRSWLWEPLLDGTVDSIFEKLPGRRIGLGGVTVVGGGRPLRFVDLLRELERLGTSLSFLRRTFHREIKGRDLASELTAVQATWRASCMRSPDTREEDAREFQRSLAELRPATVTALTPTAIAC